MSNAFVFIFILKVDDQLRFTHPPALFIGGSVAPQMLFSVLQVFNPTAIL